MYTPKICVCITKLKYSTFYPLVTVMLNHHLLNGNHYYTEESRVSFDLQYQTSPTSVVYSGHPRPRGVHINVQKGGEQLLPREAPFAENNSLASLLLHNNGGRKRGLYQEKLRVYTYASCESFHRFLQNLFLKYLLFSLVSLTGFAACFRIRIFLWNSITIFYFLLGKRYTHV